MFELRPRLQTCPIFRSALLVSDSRLALLGTGLCLLCVGLIFAVLASRSFSLAIKNQNTSFSIMLHIPAHELLFWFSNIVPMLEASSCPYRLRTQTDYHRGNPRVTPTLVQATCWFLVHHIPGYLWAILFLYIRSCLHKLRLQASFLWTQHPGFLL